MKRDHLKYLAILIAVVCPTLPVLGNPANIAAALLAIVLLSSSGARAPVTGLIYAMLIIATLISMSTVVGLLQIGGFSSFNPNALGPYLRALICFQALRCTDDPTAIQRRLLWLGAGASLFAVLQFLSPDVIARITSDYYLASERSTVFTDDFSGDSVIRVIGFFENPSSVGLLSVVLILLSVQAFSVGQLNRKVLFLFVTLNLSAGILSLSKVFVVGLMIVMLQLLVLRYWLEALLLILVAAISFNLILNSDAPQMKVIQYAFNATVDSDVALHNRYLEEVLDVLERSWVFGYGLLQAGNVVVNDSLYLEIIYHFGVIGIIVLFAFTFRLLIIEKSPMILYFLGAIIFVSGVGTSSIFSLRMEIFLTAIIANLSANSFRKIRVN